MQQFKIQDAQSRLEDLVESAIEGKEIFIVKERSKVVQLVPVEPLVRHAQFGSAKGWSSYPTILMPLCWAFKSMHREAVVIIPQSGARTRYQARPGPPVAIPGAHPL